jgi:hypothetical protein
MSERMSQPTLTTCGTRQAAVGLRFGRRGDASPSGDGNPDLSARYRLDRLSDLRPSEFHPFVQDADV